MKISQYAIVTIIAISLTSQSFAQCEPGFVVSGHAIIGGPGIQNLTTLDIVPDSFGYSVIAAGISQGISTVTVNGEATHDTTFAPAGVAMAGIDFPHSSAPVFNTIDIDDALPSTQKVYSFPGGLLLAGTITSNGNCNPTGAIEDLIYCSGISNGIGASYNAQGQYLTVLNIGGSGRVEMKDILHVSDDRTYVLINYKDTVNIEDTIQLVSMGGWDNVVICYDRNGKYVKHSSLSSENDFRMTSLDCHAGSLMVMGTLYSTENTAEISIDGQNFIGLVGGSSKIEVRYEEDNLIFERAQFSGGLGRHVLTDMAMGASTLNVDGPIRGDLDPDDLVVVVAGLFTDSIDLDPGPDELKLYSNGGQDIFLVCYNGDFELLWGTTMGSPGVDNGKAVEIDAHGNVYMTGYFSQTMELSSATTSMRFPDDNIELNSNGFTDIFVGKWGPNGQLKDGFSMGSAGYDGGNDIAVDTAGNVYIAAFFKDSMDIGLGEITNFVHSEGLDDAIVLRVLQNCPGAVSISTPLAGINFVDAEGDPDNVVDTIETGCANCILSLIEWRDILADLNIPGTCDHLAIKVSSPESEESRTILINPNQDEICPDPVSGVVQADLQLGPSGSVAVEYFETQDDLPDAIDASLITGELNFTLCGPGPCNLSLDSIGLGPCIHDSFDLVFEIGYRSSLPFIDSLIIATFDTTVITAANSNGPTVVTFSLPADSSVQDISIQLQSDTSCFVFVENAYTAPAPCEEPKSLVIDTVLVGECNVHSDSFKIGVVLTYTNPFNEDLQFDVFGGTYAFPIDESGTDTFGIILLANGEPENLITASFITHMVLDTISTALFDAPASCLECNISIIEITEVGACDAETNTYKVDIALEYSGEPDSEVREHSTAILEVTLGEQYFQAETGISGTDTISLFPLADGQEMVDVAVRFMADTICSTALKDAYDAPEQCDPTSVERLNKYGITWYPVPANQNLVVAFGEVDAAFWDIKIFDSFGREVISETHQPSYESNVEIALDKLSSGVHLIVIKTADKRVVGKIVKL